MSRTDGTPGVSQDDVDHRLLNALDAARWGRYIGNSSDRAALGMVPKPHAQRQDLIFPVHRVSVAQIEESAQELERAALGANVPSFPPSQFPITAGRHTFAASTAERDTFESGNLQLLAIHLTWYLHRIRVIPTQEANEWLQKWGAVEVGV
ncbi:MAG: hypothetical protein H7A20_09275 [Rhodanobacteraceae bacterium]|nr:hypothetical protein [Rhodanobacteraceae bacterium]